MRQAIVTKYLGPTNHRGSRIKATCEAGSITVPYDHALSGEGNHCAAAHALIRQLGWGDGVAPLTGTPSHVGGGLPGGGYCFVMLP